MDTNSLSHTKWNCRYYVVFAPKYRRQVIYGKLRLEIGKILRQLCAYKGVEIIEAEACPESYTYVNIDSTENISFIIHGIFESGSGLKYKTTIIEAFYATLDKIFLCLISIKKYPMY